MQTALSSPRATFGHKVAAGIFDPVARHLREDIREDRLAEGIGLTFEIYLRYVDRGFVLDDALLVHACHMRAIDLSRRLAGAAGSQPKKDVFDERNYHDGKIEVFYLGIESDEEDSALGYAAPLTANPTGHILSALSLEDWLSGLCERDQALLALRQAGHTLTEIAAGIVTGGAMAGAAFLLIHGL